MFTADGNVRRVDVYTQVYFPGVGDEVIVRYKTHGTMRNMRISVTTSSSGGRDHIAGSPVVVDSVVQSSHCNCPKPDFDKWFRDFGCKETEAQIEADLKPFPEVSFKRNSSCHRCNYLLQK